MRRLLAELGRFGRPHAPQGASSTSSPLVRLVPSGVHSSGVRITTHQPVSAVALYDLIDLIVDPVGNPYRPGAGRQPAAPGGPRTGTGGVRRGPAPSRGPRRRGPLLRAQWAAGRWQDCAAQPAARSGQPRGWITAKVETGADAPLAVALNQASVRGMRTATGKHPEPRLRRLLGVFKSFGITVDPTGVTRTVHGSRPSPRHC